jgi:hypothetical protein
MGFVILLILLVFIGVAIYRAGQRRQQVNEDKFEDHWKDGYDT